MQPRCPKNSELDRFLEGEITVDLADSIEQHIAECPECTRRLCESEADDTLVDILRQGMRTWSDDNDSVVRDVTARMRALPVWLAGQPVSSVSSSSVETESIPSAVLALLQAPLRLEEIGRLGKYSVVGLLGRGAMGVVLDAIDTVLERPVALKVLLPDRFAANESARQRFRREAVLAAAVRHENIVTIYDVGEIGNALYLAFERLAGETLQDRLDRLGSLAVPEALHIVEKTLNGLKAAHDQQLIHRDIKPANIWLVEEPGVNRRISPSSFANTIKLLDFGLALALDVDSRLTLHGTLLGTPGYWSPEQVSGGTIDGRSDLFSVGCVLYRMLTGQLPFAGTDLLGYFTALATVTPPPPSMFHPSIPREVDTFVARLLAKQPADRFRSVEDCLVTLTAIRRSSELPASPVIQRISDANQSHSPRRFRVALLLVVLGLAALLTAVVIRVATRDGTIVISGATGDIEVEVKGTDAEPRVVLVDQQTEYEIRVPPGEYELRVRQQGGLEFSTSKPIRIVRGGKEIVRVEYLLERQDNVNDKDLDRRESLRNEGQIAHQLTIRPVQSIGGQFLRHWMSTACIATNRSADRLLTGGADGLARLWDMTGQSLVCELDAHSSQVTAVALHPTQDLLVTGGDDGLLKIWRAREGASADYQLLKTMVLNSAIHTIRFNNSGTLLATMTRESARLHDFSSMEMICELPCHAADSGIAHGLAFLHQSDRMAVRGDHAIRIVDCLTGDEISSITVGDDIITAIDVSPDDQRILAGIAAPRSSVVIIELANRQVTTRFESLVAEDEPIVVQFSPDNQRLMALFGRRANGVESDPTGSNCIRQWRIDDGEEMASIKASVFNSGFLDASYIGGGRQIVGVSRDVWGGVWDALSAKRIPLNEPAPYFALAVSAITAKIAAGAADGKLHVVDARDMSETLAFAAHDGQLSDVEFNSKGDQLLTTGMDGTVRMWHVPTGDNIWTSRHFSTGVQWVNGSDRVLAGGRWYEHLLQGFSATNGRENSQPQSWATSAVTAFAVANSSLVATGHAVDPVKLWNLDKSEKQAALVAEPLAAYCGANALAFSPDSTLLAAAYDRTVEHHSRIALWDAATHELRATQEAYDGRVMAMAFDPSGQALATGTWGDCSVRVWQIPTLRLLATVQVGPSHAGVFKLGYFDEGRKLAVLGSDGRLHILSLEWSVAPSDSVE